MNSEFPNTRLSVIERIRQGDDEDRLAALETFVDAYRPALVAFLTRCKGVEETDADDLVQDFILNKIMNGKVLDGANGKGRFRNLLRVSLQRYLIDSLRKKNRQRIDDEKDLEEVQFEAPAGNDQIDQVWAEAVFSAALNSLKMQSPYWDLFYDRVLTQPPLPYDQVIARHNYPSPEKASNCLITAKRHFNRLIEQCVREQSYWTDENTEEDLMLDVDLLKNMLGDPHRIQQIVDGLGNDPKNSISLTHADHSIMDEHVVFVEESADNVWESSDLPLIFEHLLGQPAEEYSDCPAPDLKLGDLLFANSLDDLNSLVAIKEFFNKRGKTKNGLLPEKVNVTMTFVSISAFVRLGGQVNDITSMQPHILANRIEKLSGKSWLPSRFKSLFDQAIEMILA